MEIEYNLYKPLLEAIVGRIKIVRINANRAINFFAIQLNYEIGEQIVIRPKKHGWGKSVVERLSKDLTDRMEGLDGFSVQNLWLMRQFYLSYFTKAFTGAISEQAEESLKSVYNLDFLGLIPPVLERKLENHMIARIKELLMELGYGFCFMGNQYSMGIAEYRLTRELPEKLKGMLLSVEELRQKLKNELKDLKA